MTTFSGSTPDASPLPRTGFLLLAVVVAGWGLTWPSVKIAVSEIDPWTFRAVTVCGGGILLLLIAAAFKLPLRLPAGTWRPLVVSSVFNIVGWHLFSAFGILHMGSGHAALIAYSMPLWAAIAGVYLLGERLTARRCAVMALGMVGIVILLPDGGKLSDGSFMGVGLMLCAAISWAIGVVHFKSIRWQAPIVVIAAWQHLIGSLPMAVIVAGLGFQDLTQISSNAVAAMLFLIIGPIALCTVAWYRVVILFPTRVSSLGSLLVPVVGVVSGSLILGEPLGLRELTAMALICGAVALELLHRPA